MANRVLALVRKMLNFAVDYDWIEASPAARVKKPTPEVSRERVLTDEELRRFWSLLSRFPTTAERAAAGRKRVKGTEDDPVCPVSEPLAALLKVRLLTAQRGGEVARMRWRDVDLDAGWWTIPGTDTTNGESHRVPLVEEAVDARATRVYGRHTYDREKRTALETWARVLTRVLKRKPSETANVLQLRRSS